MQQRVFFVGTQSEIGHHAAPLQGTIDYSICEPDTLLRQSKPGDLAVFYSEHFDRFRDCCRQLKDNHVATLYLIDGILEWRNAWENRADEPACPYTMRPAISHKVACIGPSQARIVESWGNPGKTEIVGIPRFERLRGVEKRQPDAGQLRLLVMTAKCPAFTESQRTQIRQSLIDLRDWLAENPTVNGKKIHVCWRLTGDLDREIGVQNELSDLSGAELASVLVSMDAVVATPTTAMLEAMILDLPTAILDYTNSPAYVRSAWNVSARQQIPAVITDLVAPAESKMVFQRQQLNDAVQLDDHPTQRLAMLIRRMLAVSKQRIAQGHGLEFPPNLLGHAALDSSQNVEFDHTKVFPDRPEFCTSDVRQTQAELAHARREIQHLHRIIDGLKDELGQAHRIFDQIQEHPIAGPVVRTRQRLIDWMARFRASKNNSSHQNPKTGPQGQPATKPAAKTG